MKPVDSEKTDAQKQIEQINKRRKRIQRFKYSLLSILVILLLFPNIVSIYLLIQNYQLQKQIDGIYSFVTEESEIEETENITYLSDADKEEFNELQIAELKYSIPDNEVYPGKQCVYLTFDDGPSKYTDEILDILAEYDVKATFFVLAKEGYEEEYKRIAQQGHTLALHSYSHKYSTIYATPEAFRDDVTMISDFIYDITGERSKFYRFPGGSSNSLVKFDKEELFKILREQELLYIDWNVASQDAGSVKLLPEKIKQNVLDGVKGRNSAVVLMHDASDKYTTVEALPLILDELKKDDNCVVLPITEGTQLTQHVVSAYQ